MSDLLVYTLIPVIPRLLKGLSYRLPAFIFSFCHDSPLTRHRDKHTVDITPPSFLPFHMSTLQQKLCTKEILCSYWSKSLMWQSPSKTFKHDILSVLTMWSVTYMELSVEPYDKLHKTHQKSDTSEIKSQAMYWSKLSTCDQNVCLFYFSKLLVPLFYLSLFHFWCLRVCALFFSYFSLWHFFGWRTYWTDLKAQSVVVYMRRRNIILRPNAHV